MSKSLKLLFLSIILPYVVYGANDPNMNNLPNQKSLRRIYDEGGRLLIDNTLEVTGAIQADKWFDLRSITQPSTPSVKHSKLFLDSSNSRVCVLYDTGIEDCFSNSTGTINSLTAGLGLTGGGKAGDLTISLSTPIPNSYIPALSSIATSTAILTTDINNLAISTASLQTQITATGVSTGSLQGQINNVYSASTTFTTEINNIGVSTGSLQGQINNIYVASAAFTTSFTNVAASTTTLFSEFPVSLSTNTVGNLTSSHVIGTTTNNDAVSGFIGEYISSTTGGGTFSITPSATWVNLASTQASAGNWDFTCVAGMGGGTTVTSAHVVISSFSANTTTDHVLGDNWIITGPPGAAFDVSLDVANWQVKINSPTIIYCKEKSTWSGSAPSGYCRLSGRRIR